MSYELIISRSQARRLLHRGSARTPGCMADGTTCEEAVANAKAVVAEWIETAAAPGRTIPWPKGKLAYA